MHFSQLHAILSVMAVSLTVQAHVVQAQPPRAPLALEPTGSSGEAIWPAYEGWSRNEDGSLTLLVGYYNRNDEIIDIPIGEDNRLGSGTGDMGQPTHFFPGRNWGVFSITIPAEKAEERLSWSIRLNN